MPRYPDSNSVSRLGVAWLIATIAFAGIARALTYPFRSKRGATVYKDALYAAVRCMLRRITIPQSRYLNASTTERYYAFCNAHNLESHTVEVEVPGKDRVAAHWLGNSNAEAVVLYFHGGGYTQSANEGNYLYMRRLVNDLNATKGTRSVAVLMVAYTLAPEAKYPTQLREAAAVLSYVLKTPGRVPTNVFLTGDSAGGNLAVSLISHLLHPHPDVPPIPLEQPLAGAMLYSPWVSFRTNYRSNELNETVDMLPATMLRRWAAMFLDKSNPVDPELDPGPVSGDAYTEACLNPASWWTRLPQVVSDVFVWYGGDEVFVDALRDLEKTLKEGWVQGDGHVERVIFLEVPGDAHNGLFTDPMIPGNGGRKADSQVAIERWYKARLEQ